MDITGFDGPFVSMLFVQGDEALPYLDMDDDDAARALLEVALEYPPDAPQVFRANPAGAEDEIIGGEATSAFSSAFAFINRRRGYAGVVEAWSDRDALERYGGYSLLRE